jgi:hypothetical protein
MTMTRTRSSTVPAASASASGGLSALAAILFTLSGAAACVSSGGPGGTPGGDSATGGKTGAGGALAGNTGGAPASGGTGGSNASGGSGGTPSSGTGGAGPTASGGSGGTATDTAAPGPADVAAPAETGGGAFDAGGGGPFNIADYGGVGATPFVPLQYTATPVPPLVAPECPEDLTAGFTEYKAAFKVQRPSNLSAGDRFKYENGIYTFWVNSSDNSHAPGNGTAPRTEARYTDFTSGEHIWSADMMYEHVDKTCVMQIHNVVGAYATYLRIIDDRMFDLATKKTVSTGLMGKWFNMKVAFNTESLDVKVYINNCLKFSAKSPKGPTPMWYFKHGVYTCESGTCRSSYKNIHLYKKGGMPEPPSSGMGD